MSTTSLALALFSFIPSILAVSATFNGPITSSQHLYNIPSWHSHNFSCIGSPQAYAIRTSLGKGLGVFATRVLEPGAVIFREDPVILIHPPQFRDGVGYPLSGIEQQLRTAFDALPELKKAEVLGLTAHYTTAETASLDDVDELIPIFRSNAYNSGNQIGLYPKIARINHSCRPNTSYLWVARHGKLVVVASRHIDEGEELSISYVPLLLSHEDRQKRLDQYGFKCSCDACALGKDELDASDKRRKIIHQTLANLTPHLALGVPESKSGKKRAQERADASFELVKIVEEEQLLDYYAQVYRIAAILHARTEDWESATKFAHKSYQIHWMADEESEMTIEMQTLTAMFIESWNNNLRDKLMRKG